MIVTDVKLDRIEWPPGTVGRLWFCQPKIMLPAAAPFRPVNGEQTFSLLEAVLTTDAALGAPPGGAPSIILMPELCISPGRLHDLVARMQAARANTLLVCGVGHLTAKEMDDFEPSKELCGEPVAGCYANCALVAQGGSDRVYLQPKIVPSSGELDTHWAGKTVKYFQAGYFSFAVFVCSEMLNRAATVTSIRQVLDHLAKETKNLSAIFWLQHNRRPRAVDFSQSLEEFAKLDRPTLVVVGSAAEAPPRYENFGVSGALLKRVVLPRRFDLLTRKFHYVEPVKSSEALSRVVLLRYDVDVNLVHSVLANAIEPDARTEKSQFFEAVRPMILQGHQLVDEDSNTHLTQVVAAAVTRGTAFDQAYAAHVNALGAALAALGTASFQAFLDRAILPRPMREQVRHRAGQLHQPADYHCDCWTHRQCMDLLSDDPEAVEPLAQLLHALGKLVSHGFEVTLLRDLETAANVRLTCGAGIFELSIVYPFAFDADASEHAIRGGAQRPRIQEPGYIILGTSGRSGRPSMATISQAIAKEGGAVKPAVADPPLLRTIYHEELSRALAQNALEPLLQQRFG
jgi:hypothetical protein